LLVSPMACTDEEFARLVPKVENHVHLDGSFDYDYLLELLLLPGLAEGLPEHGEVPVRGTRFPVRGAALEVRALLEKGKRADALALLKRHITVDSKTCDTLWDFLAPFKFFLPIVEEAAKRDTKHVEELAFRFVRRQKESNVIYTEARYSPHLLLAAEEREGDGETRCRAAMEFVEVVTRGFRRGEQEFGVRVNQILCCICSAPAWSPDCAKIMREVKSGRLLPGPGSTVVSIDVAAGEAHYDDDALGSLHRAACSEVYTELGYNVCVHAGEATGGSAEHVRQAVRDYGAIRVGHGYKVLDDVGLLDRAIPDFLALQTDRRGSMRLHFECCPSSSLSTGGFDKSAPWVEHPLKRLHARGASCGINTDDPSVIDITLSSEYELCLKHMQFTRGELLEMAMNQVESCFIDDGAEKERIRDAVREGYERLMGGAVG